MFSQLKARMLAWFTRLRKRVARKLYPPYGYLETEVALMRAVSAANRTDPLTGAGIRIAYDLFDVTVLGKSLHRLVVDLDHFKQINDDLGHQMGDRVLGYVGESIRAVCDSYDLSVRQRFYRYGGDELVICVEEEIAALVACSIETEITASQRPVAYRDLPLVTVTCGYGPDFSAADAALYRRKAAR